MQTTKLVVWGKLPRKRNIEGGRPFFTACRKAFSCLSVDDLFYFLGLVDGKGWAICSTTLDLNNVYRDFLSLFVFPPMIFHESTLFRQKKSSCLLGLKFLISYSCGSCPFENMFCRPVGDRSYERQSKFHVKKNHFFHKFTKSFGRTKGPTHVLSDY